MKEMLKEKMQKKSKLLFVQGMVGKFFGEIHGIY